MLTHERLELADQLGLAAAGKVGVDSFLERRQPELLQAGRGSLGERREPEVGESRPAGEREGFAQRRRGGRGRAGGSLPPGALDESLEPGEIELVRLELEQIARGTGEESIEAARLEGLPQPGYEHL